MKKRLTSAERRKMIIEFASEAFAKQGYDATRTRDIAQECDMNEALLYRHFESKKILYLEVLREVHGQYAASLNEYLNLAETGFEALSKLAYKQFQSCGQDRLLTTLMLHAMQLAVSDEDVRELVNEWFNFHHKQMADQVKRGIEDKSIKPDIDPEKATFCLRYVIWGFIMHMATGCCKDTNATYTEKNIDGILELIRNPENESASIHSAFLTRN